MVDLGPVGRSQSPDDPIEALTKEDREWLKDHGWRGDEYPPIGTERVIGP